jgi:hypothetical protein
MEFYFGDMIADHVVEGPIILRQRMWMICSQVVTWSLKCPNFLPLWFANLSNSDKKLTSRFWRLNGLIERIHDHSYTAARLPLSKHATILSILMPERDEEKVA